MKDRRNFDEARQFERTIDRIIFIAIMVLIAAVAVRLVWEASAARQAPTFERVSWQPPQLVWPVSTPRLPRPGEPGGNPHPENPFNVRDYVNPFLCICP